MGTLLIPRKQELDEVQRTNMLAIERWAGKLHDTRLILPDASILDGDVSVLQGNGIVITKVGNGFRLTAALGQSMRAVPAFAPGAAVARILQRATIPTPILQALDIYLGTAPVGVNPTNCANVVVKGTTSGGPIVVPLAAGIVEYHVNVASLTTPLAGSVSTGTVAGRAERAMAYGFQVSTTITVLNMDLLFNSAPGASNVRAGIATGVTLNTTPVLTPNWITDIAGNQCFAEVSGASIGSGSRPLFAFPSTAGFKLVPGTTYFMVASMLTNTQQLEVQDGTTNTLLGNLSTNGPVYTDSSSGGPYTDIFDTISGAVQYPTFNLYGAILGTPLVGLVEVSQTITGAPPGTTGSDANIIAQV